MNKIITFLLPGPAMYPIGGFKVVFEYANRLISAGYKVNIIYGVASNFHSNKVKNILYKIIKYIKYLRLLRSGKFKPDNWFKLNDNINQILSYNLNQQIVPVSDFYIATAWSTARRLNEYLEVESNNKLYLIQSFESWATSEENVYETWKMDIRKIVIAPWLQDIANRLDVQSCLIENGFDQERFFIENSVKKRNPKSVIMLWHHHLLKGCQYGLNALILVKKEHPDIVVTFFGVNARPKDLPNWILYYQQPSADLLRKLYNSSSIFLGPSILEGFCLTPPEAMLCGCSVVCTDIGGYTVVCIPNKTALVSPVQDSDGLANNILKLISNDPFRIQLSENGTSLIKTFTWDIAFDKFLVFVNEQHS